jgi:hypothetical protein
MRSIFVRVEPTVRLVTDAAVVDLLIALHLIFEARPVRKGCGALAYDATQTSELPPEIDIVDWRRLDLNVVISKV